MGTCPLLYSTHSPPTLLQTLHGGHSHAVAYNLLMNRRAANRRTRWGRMYLEKM